MIYRYVKYVTREISRTLECDETCTELATVGGVTYVHVPDDYELPVQPAEIAESVKPVTLTPELRDAIKAASPHVWLINERVREKIAELYPLHEEIKLLRTAPSPEFDSYNQYAEECMAWGRDQKAGLGLASPGPEVPHTVTMRQARLALLQSDLLHLVDDAIEALPEPDRSAARIEWEYSQAVERDRPFVQMLGAALGLDEGQIDDLFRLAVTL